MPLGRFQTRFFIFWKVCQCPAMVTSFLCRPKSRFCLIKTRYPIRKFNFSTFVWKLMLSLDHEHGFYDGNKKWSNILSRTPRQFSSSNERKRFFSRIVLINCNDCGIIKIVNSFFGIWELKVNYVFSGNFKLLRGCGGVCFCRTDWVYCSSEFIVCTQKKCVAVKVKGYLLLCNVNQSYDTALVGYFPSCITSIAKHTVAQHVPEEQGTVRN